MSDPQAAVRFRRPQESASSGVRELMLGWCLWLLGSWAVTLAQASPMPGGRWMVFAAATGLMLAWPAFRLSQGAPRAQDGTLRPPPVGLIFLDWLCLMLILQAVIWPLRLVGSWSYPQAAWLDAAIVSWTLLTGAIVAGARQFESGWARAAGMVLCVLLVVGEPAARALFGEAGGEDVWLRVSPIGVLWELTGRPYDVAWPAVRQSVTLAALAGGLAWAGLAAVRLAWRFRRRRERTEQAAEERG